MIENASKYADLSEKAYADSIFLAGYESHFISNGSTRCHVLISDHEQIVAFRGTEGNIEDILTDLKCRKHKGIHRGFLAAHQTVIGDIYKLIDSRKKVTFTGHSLGGALAILSCAFHGESESRAITFGAPRVFDINKARQYRDKKIFRFENAGDPVPFIPFYGWGYRHIGDYCLLNANLSTTLNPAPFTPFMDMFFSSTRQKAISHSIKTYKEKIQRIPHV